MNLNNIHWKKTQKHSIIFFIGGVLYVTIELVWRGYSHWSMFILGGLCFLLLGHINESKYTRNMALIPQMFISTIIITILEFIFGLIFNVWLNIGIWDYSNMPFNILGQICLPFCGIWFLLSLIGILLDDRVRYIIFSEDLPKYKLL